MTLIRALRLLRRAGLVGTFCLGLLAGCSAPKPKVICAMKNPETGQKVVLYKEIWFKVPRGYDEKKHIEEWKAEQCKKGFTVEVRE
jgi:hypothetical protein